MDSNTPKLYGTARHDSINVFWEGQNICVRFVGPDYAAHCERYGFNLPDGLCEKLYAIPGSYVRFPGGIPGEVAAAAAKDRGKQQVDDLRNQQDVSDDAWPREAMTVKELGSLAKLAGATDAEIKNLAKKELLELAQELTAKQYPGLAEKHGYKAEATDEGAGDDGSQPKGEATKEVTLDVDSAGGGGAGQVK